MNCDNVKASRRLVTRKMKGNTGYITVYTVMYVFPRDFSAWGGSRRTSRAKMRQTIKVIKGNR